MSHNPSIAQDYSGVVTNVTVQINIQLPINGTGDPLTMLQAQRSTRLPALMQLGLMPHHCLQAEIDGIKSLLATVSVANSICIQSFLLTCLVVSNTDQFLQNSEH
jgi:hypothetical protein